MIAAGIIGGSGYVGGELLRLLLSHPQVRVQFVTSRSLLDRPLAQAHPHLRGHSDLQFSAAAAAEPVDVLFLCLPHGVAARDIDRWRALGKTVIDLSADFRLRSPERYREWYGEAHPAPQLLSEAVYGLPEVSREALAGASLISGVGCNATAMILALLPLARAGLIEGNGRGDSIEADCCDETTKSVGSESRPTKIAARCICDIKVGSSEAGREPSRASHHPERSRAIRSYAPAGHRHAAEVLQALGDFSLDVSVTAVETVRGVLCTAHIFPAQPLDKKTLWRLYRATFAAEPFVRIVCEQSGLHRLPDPRTLTGSNYADVGFALDERSGRVISICAIDNLVKGAAGSAVQSMNIALGLEETAGLMFPGLYPV